MLIFVYPPTVIQLSTSKLCYTKIFAYMCDICPCNMKATSIWNAILRMCLNQDLYVYMACFYIVPNLKCNTAPPAHLCFVQTPLLLQVSLTRLFPTDGNVFLFENFHFFFFFETATKNGVSKKPRIQWYYPELYRQDVPTLPNTLPHICRAFSERCLAAEQTFYGKEYFRWWILRRKEMQLRGDVLPLALQYRSDLVTKVCWILNHCIENRVGFEYASRNEDATDHVWRNLFGEHAKLKSKNCCENCGNNCKLPPSPDFFIQNCASRHWAWASTLRRNALRQQILWEHGYTWEHSMTSPTVGS